MVTLSWQDVETDRQLRSRIIQRLNVQTRVRLPSSFAAASLDGLFEHPAGSLFIHRLSPFEVRRKA